MGKKTKVGKQRKDKFYHLAKETGYRSRAAFKLIQLNRKFEFLQKSRVLVDLCAAPGGWMQVAVQHMPVSSIVIGVDLFPIKAVAGTIAIQEDITSPRCLSLLKKEMKTWKADVVLNDGAPNVGQNWLHDAYSQNCLTLSAFKLATELLKPGGFFVTKVFRSKDYNSLIWVLQQFFKNVFSTKPAASRTESAEIFVVCKGYLAPHTIDPKFLDAKYVFDEISVPEGKKQLQQLLQEVGKKKKPEGYPSGETLLYKPIKASEFIRSSDHIELLSNTSAITLDEDWIIKNGVTTPDIIDYCADVKVLGKKEIKALVTWRKQLRDKLDQFAKLKGEQSEMDDIKPVEEIDGEEDEDDGEVDLETAIETMKNSQLKEAKKKRKKLLKERRKIHEKTNMKMIIPGDSGPTDTIEDSLFALKTIKSSSDVQNLTEGATMPNIDDTQLNSDEELELYEEKRRSRKVKYDKSEEILDSSGRYYKKMDSDGEDSGKGSDEDDEDPDLRQGLGLAADDEFEGNENFDIDEVAPIASHPLITDLDHSDKNQKRLRKAQMWFAKDVFKDLNDESDEDAELSKLAESYEKKGAQIVGFKKNTVELKAKKAKLSEEKIPKRRKSDEEKHSLEIVADEPKKKKKKLDVEALALGTLMVESNKSRRDLLEDGWNRYAFNDTGLPTWFVEDEKKHARKKLPVPESLVEEYKKNLQEINARPIKKVVEAKARKKKRAIRKLERAKKKAEAILEKTDVSESEKASQLKQLYKKAKVTKKKEVTYVVAKKFNSSQRAKRPAGVKGQYRVVDPRMKKDMRKMKANTKETKGKGGKGKMGRGGGGGKGKAGRGGGGGKGKGRR